MKHFFMTELLEGKEYLLTIIPSFIHKFIYIKKKLVSS